MVVSLTGGGGGGGAGSSHEAQGWQHAAALGFPPYLTIHRGPRTEPLWCGPRCTLASSCFQILPTRRRLRHKGPTHAATLYFGEVSHPKQCSTVEPMCSHEITTFTRVCITRCTGRSQQYTPAQAARGQLHGGLASLASTCKGAIELVIVPFWLPRCCYSFAVWPPHRPIA